MSLNLYCSFYAIRIEENHEASDLNGNFNSNSSICQRKYPNIEQSLRIGHECAMNISFTRSHFARFLFMCRSLFTMHDKLLFVYFPERKFVDERQHNHMPSLHINISMCATHTASTLGQMLCLVGHSCVFAVLTYCLLCYSHFSYCWLLWFLLSCFFISILLSAERWLKLSNANVVVLCVFIFSSKNGCWFIMHMRTCAWVHTLASVQHERPLHRVMFFIDKNHSDQWQYQAALNRFLIYPLISSFFFISCSANEKWPRHFVAQICVRFFLFAHKNCLSVWAIRNSGNVFDDKLICFSRIECSNKLIACAFLLGSITNKSSRHNKVCKQRLQCDRAANLQ